MVNSCFKESRLSKLIEGLLHPTFCLGLLGLASWLSLTDSVRGADYFADPSAGSAKDQWQAPEAHAKLTASGVVFTGTSNDERAYVRTEAAGYDKESFVAEATLKVEGDGALGIAYFGLGAGEGNPEAYSEPSTNIVEGLKVCPTAFTQTIKTFDAAGESTPTIGPGNGTHRVRMTWDAAEKVALFELDNAWEGREFQPRYRLVGGPVKGAIPQGGGRLFFGGGSGVSVSDFSVRPASSEEVGAMDTGGVNVAGLTARTWLPLDDTAKPKNDKALTPVDELLSTLNGQARLLECRYQGNTLINSSAFTNGGLKTGDTTWQSTVTAAKPPGAGDEIDLDVKFKVLTGTAKSSGVAVAFDFLKWDAENYVFAPGMLYNGNRFKILPIPYPPYIYDPAERPIDMPTTTTNLLHLNKDLSPGLVEMKTFNLATPMMGFYDHKAKRGFLLLTEPGTSAGVSGMIVQEDPAKKMLTMVVNAPGVRAERYSGSGGRAPSDDKGATLKAGSEITLKFKVYNFTAADIPAFLAKTFEIRKALTGPNTFRNVAPYSAIAKIVGEHQDQMKWYEDEEFGYYSNSTEAKPNYNQIGWAGVPIYSHPPAILQTPERLRRVGRSWDMLRKAQGKSGLFYGMLFHGKPRGDAFDESEARPHVSMVRRSGDVLFFGVQQLEVLRAHGEGKMIKPEWEATLKRCADGLVNLYEKYGQFGQFADADTGEMEINGSTAGSACVSGLALASEYFKNPKYLKVAEEAGEMYYKRDLSQGYAGGGAAEILQSPDSEAPWDLCEACLALYEITGKQVWLDHARDAINMLATWMMSYDYEFPPESDLGRVGTKTAGSIFASSANNCSTPGFYILSGDFLLRYYRATGDPRYAELYKDTAHNAVQYVNLENNRIQPNGRFGYVSERVQVTDWEGTNFGRVHDGDTNYAWECLAQLTSLQNPGIYLNTTTGAMIVLDHVKTEIISHDASGTKLKLTNETPYDAEVSVFAETAEQARTPLGYTAFLKWPKVAVKSGETKEIAIEPSGKIRR